MKIGGIELRVDERMPRGAAAFVQDTEAGPKLLGLITNLSYSTEVRPMEERYAVTQAADPRYRTAAGTTSAPHVAPLINVALNSIESVTKELDELTRRVGEFVLGTLGPIPELTNIAKSGRSEPSGGYRAEVLHERLAALHNQVGELRMQVNRLDGI